MLRLLLAATIGMFAASVVLTVTQIDHEQWLWLPITGGVMTALLVIVSIGRAFASTASAQVPDVEAADRDGRVFLAKVLEVRATGSSINDQPICEIRLLAQPRNRAAYQTTIRSLVNLGRLASLQRGAIVVVAQPDADRPELSLLDQPPSHWQRLADTDSRLSALDSAPEWTMPPARGKDRNGLRRIPAVLLVIAFVAGVGIRVWPVRAQAWDVLTGTPVEQVQAEAAATAAAEQSIFPAERAQRVVDDLVEASGVTQFTSLSFFGTYAAADALTAPDALTTDSWIWRDGAAQHQGPELIQADAEDLPDQLFDITTIDVSLVQQLVDQLPGLTGIDDPDPTVYVMRALHATTTTPTEFALSTRNDYYDAWVTTDATGQVIAMRGGTPDSQSAQWEADNG